MPGSERTRRPDVGTSQFVVLVVDPETGELDSYGPYDYPGALAEGSRRREEFDRADLVDVFVVVVPLHPGPEAAAG